MEADGVELWAGPLAEARFRKIGAVVVILTGGSEDFARIEHITGEFARTLAERYALIGDLEKRARKLIRDRRNWRAILDLSAALLCCWSLTGDEVTAIIEASHITDVARVGTDLL
jgi:hypothetical protein